MNYETYSEQMRSFGVEPMSRKNFDAMKAEEARIKAEKAKKELVEEALKEVAEKPKRIRVSTNKKYIIKGEPKTPRPRYIVKSASDKPRAIRNKWNSAEYQRELYARKKAEGIERSLKPEEILARRERALKYYHENKEKIREKHNAYYATLPEDKKQRVRENNKRACQKRIANMTEAEREARRQADKDRRHNMTPEEKIAYKARLKQKREEKAALMTDEQRKERSKRHLMYKKNMEATLTPEQKEEKLEYARYRRTLRKRGVSVENIRPLWSWESKDKQFPLGSVVWSKND